MRSIPGFTPSSGCVRWPRPRSATRPTNAGRRVSNWTCPRVPSRGSKRRAPTYVVLLHATARAEKAWPAERWIGLIAVLCKAGITPVLPWGNATEHEAADTLVRDAIGPTTGAATRALVAPGMSLPDCAALIGDARAVVGVDTGLLHLAAALDVPTVGLFGATPRWRYAPYWSPRAINLGSFGELGAQPGLGWRRGRAAAARHPVAPVLVWRHVRPHRRRNRPNRRTDDRGRSLRALVVQRPLVRRDAGRRRLPAVAFAPPARVSPRLGRTLPRALRTAARRPALPVDPRGVGGRDARGRAAGRSAAGRASLARPARHPHDPDRARHRGSACSASASGTPISPTTIRTRSPRSCVTGDRSPAS